MDYNEAIEFINTEKIGGAKKGITSMKELLLYLGNPEKNLNIIHIAGTNGKGSTASFIARMLMEAGYKVGKYTSPHIEKVNERVQINENNILDEELANLTRKVKDACNKLVENNKEHPRVFEIITAIAFLYFKEKKVDFIVLEVGLGGKYDATNVISSPLASVITTINIDHVDTLGNDLCQIAREKAGIIKENGLVFSYPQDGNVEKIIREKARKKAADLYELSFKNISNMRVNPKESIFDFKYQNYSLKDIRIKLLGEHQIYNASLAILVLLELRSRNLLSIKDRDIYNGLKETFWPGRLEILREKPMFIIDGAHNEQSALELKKALELFDYHRLILGIGILKDKDYSKILEILSDRADKVIVTKIDGNRALETSSLVSLLEGLNKDYIVEENIKNAILSSINIAGSEDLIVFAGSLYLISDVRKILREIE